MLPLRAPLAAPTRLSRRLLEWSLLAILVLFVVMMFLRQTLVVRGQAELASVKTTIAALRTAMAIHQLEMQIAGHRSVVDAQQQNPFLLLQRKPLNYVGETDLTSPLDAHPGSWIFTPLADALATFQPMRVGCQPRMAPRLFGSASVPLRSRRNWLLHNPIVGKDSRWIEPLLLSIVTACGRIQTVSRVTSYKF